MQSNIDDLLDRADGRGAGRADLPAPTSGTPCRSRAWASRRMRVSDGPVGARGTRFDGEATHQRAVQLAARGHLGRRRSSTRIGELLGRETKAKGASVLLAPTVNLHRTPVGGRNFECMSEDPYLTSRVAVAYVRGLQSEGVACCIKHFVGNDTEFERNTIDSRIDERTLREVYLRPFEAAVRDGRRAWP